MKQEDLDAIVAEALTRYPGSDIDPETVSSLEVAAEIKRLADINFPRMATIAASISRKMEAGGTLSRLESGVMVLAPYIHAHLEPKVSIYALALAIVTTSLLADAALKEPERSFEVRLREDCDEAIAAVFEIGKLGQLKLLHAIMSNYPTETSQEDAA